MSQHTPVLPVEAMISYLPRCWENCSEVYWHPRSEWKIVSPLVYGHLRAAISIASHIRSVRMLSAIAYPTAFFVQQSRTVARYTNPSQVRIYVISPTHFTPGWLAVKFRRTRSGREPRSAAGTVVRTFRRGCAASRPCSRMTERTVSGLVSTPLRARAAWTLRYP